VNSTDGTGPRYRKIGLNGSPMADDKPQDRDESAAVPEDTYIDAFTSELRHGVSDVHVSLDSSLLPLTVRRDVTDDVWNESFGIQPYQQPDRPFGTGWTSNLCATVRLDGNAFHATVTDEQGAAHSFYRVQTEGGGSYWRAAKDAKDDIKSRWNTLEYIGSDPSTGGTFVYRKAFGSVCTYQYCTTRTNGDGALTDLIQFFRITQVQDRLQNKLVYQYPAAQQLIPSRISDSARPGLVISINQDFTRHVITRVTGPGGDITDYSYTPTWVGMTSPSVVQLLTSVTRHAANNSSSVTSNYAYSIALEGSVAPWHAAVNNITDELGHSYSFAYRDNDLVYYTDISNGVATTMLKTGLPRLVTHVTLPDSGVTTFNTVRDAPIRNSMKSGAYSQTQVNGPGGQYTYYFSQPYVEATSPPASDSGIMDPNPDTTVSFTRLDINSDAGVETYTFTPSSGMALASATDMFGNITSYTYWRGFDDTYTEANALGDSKSFSYEATTRVMNSETDELGVSTVTDVEPHTGRHLAERIYDVDGSMVAETLYEYHPTFRGFMTKKTVKALAPAEGTDYFVDHVTQYLPDENGRVWKEIRDPGGINATTIYLYDGNGNKVSETDPLGNTTQYAYDVHNHMIRQIHPDGTHKDLVYDAHGNVIQESNENGVKTFYQYDLLNRRTKTTVDLNGNGTADASYTTATLNGNSVAYNGDIVISTTYNGRGQVLTQTDALGKVLTNTYDTVGRVLSTDDGRYTTFFEYGTNSGGSLFDGHAFKPTKVTDPRGMETFNAYDALYRVVTKSSVIGGTTTNTYDAAGHLLTVTDPLNLTTTNTYDAHGQLLTTTYPDTNYIQNFYTHTGKVWKTVDELEDVNLTQYDALDRASRHFAPAVDGQSPTTVSAYDAAGHARFVTDPMGRVTETQYNSRNKPVKVIAPAVLDATTQTMVQPVTLTEYDNMLQVTKVTDPLGAVTSKSYDAAGRHWKTTDALNHSTVSLLDPVGNATAVQNAAGQIVHHTYDLHSRLTHTQDAAGVTNDFTYDAAGNKTAIKDGLNQGTFFEYDLLNRLTKQTFANGDFFNYTYDAVRKLSHTDCKGAVTTYEYNLRYKQTKTSFYPPNNTQTPDSVREMTYDDGGRLTLVTETNNPNATVSYTYDALNRMTSETSNGVQQLYTYDLAGNRTQVDHGTGRVVQTTFDALNRPVLISEGGRTTHYGYDTGGRAVLLVAANGQVTTNTYDDLGRVVDRTLFYSTTLTQANVQAEFDWTYDVLGNVTAQREVWPGSPGRATGLRTTTMTYDGANRLLTERVTAPGSEGTTATTYAYDAANNRSSKTVTGGREPGYWSYTYNEANQLVGWQKLTAQGGTVLKTATLTYDRQ
jgi:YD repeat-containing protein